MDINYPMNGDRVYEKVIIMVHGGGLEAGDKSDYTDVVKALSSKFRYVMFVNMKTYGNSAKSCITKAIG